MFSEDLVKTVLLFSPEFPKVQTFFINDLHHIKHSKYLSLMFNVNK